MTATEHDRVAPGAPPPPSTGMRVVKAVLGLILVMFLGLVVPLAAGLLAVNALRMAGVDVRHDTLRVLYVQHGLQLVLALLVILVLKRLVPTDYGLHPPRGRSYVGAALLWGAVFGLIMLLVDYAPQLLAHTKPSLGYPVMSASAGGWLVFEGIYVGPTEEIPFRSMLVPLFMALWPARLRLGRFEMHWAGVVVALLFALLHAANFSTRPWPIALGQQVYAFALGVLYAYWLEKSGSVLAPSIGHNASDAVEYLLLYGWVGIA